MLGFFLSKSTIMDASVLMGRTDHHSHILPGVDDGIRTLEDALDVLSFEESLAVTDVWCTPHIMEDFPNTTEDLRLRFDALKEAYKGNITLHLAAEYMLDNLFAERLEARDILTINDEYILVEASTWNPPPRLDDTLQDILGAGYRPLFAHPERYGYLEDDDYVKLYNMGVRFQMNIGSVVGYYGKAAQNKAYRLLKTHMYEAIGSDCHRLKTFQEQVLRKVSSKFINLI